MRRLTTAINNFTEIIPGEYLLKTDFLLFAILCLGIFARAWDFGKLPSGLIADEASIGVASFSLLHYGLDQNGETFPIQFISFGSGQNALYGYLMIPFIAIFGLKAVTVKLPMLICGILTLPLLYWVTRRTFDKRIALISTFFLAISPWHIMLSRFGLESNLLPFIFILGYACLLKSFENGKWFIVACILLAGCLYTYGTTYLMIPLFMACVLVILIRGNQVRYNFMTAGFATFMILSIPIGLFVLINLLGLDAIKIGPVTIPHLPTQPRFESETGDLLNQLPRTLAANSWILINLLVKQSDGIIYNTIEPYGYFYGVTFPLAIIGVVLLFHSLNSHDATKILLLLAWLGVSLIFGVIQPVNVNRINIIFIPILITMAVAVDWLGEKIAPIIPIAIFAFLLAFVAFTLHYHGAGYKKMADIKFHTGLLSAIQYVSTSAKGPICMTSRIDMPYIYVLFVEKPDPKSYLSSIQYINTDGQFRQVRSVLRYTFGKENCVDQPDTAYLFRSDDGLPKTGGKYTVEVFNDFHVFVPKP